MNGYLKYFITLFWNWECKRPKKDKSFYRFYSNKGVHSCILKFKPTRVAILCNAEQSPAHWKSISSLINQITLIAQKDLINTVLDTVRLEKNVGHQWAGYLTTFTGTWYLLNLNILSTQRNYV